MMNKGFLPVCSSRYTAIVKRICDFNNALVKMTSTALPAFACAKFKNPCTRHKQLAAIDTKQIKNFSGKEIKEKKMVRVECGETFCSAVLLFTGETLQSVEASITATDNKRLKIPNQRTLDSPSGTSDSETDTQRGKKSDLEKSKSGSILDKKLSDLKQKHLTPKNDAKEMPKEITKEITKEMPANSKNNKEDVTKEDEGQLQKARNEFKKVRDVLEKVNDQLKQAKNEITKLKLKLESEVEQKNELFRLNVELQRKVIGLFTDVNTNLMEMQKDVSAIANINGKECAEKVGFIKDDQVHLGRNVWIKKIIYDAIKGRNKITPTLFVKEMALAVFGMESLLRSTVTGTTSNRKKKNQSENSEDTFQKLDPVKILAITDITYFWMISEKKSDNVTAERERSKVASYISHKISELKRRNAKVQEMIVASDREMAAIQTESTVEEDVIENDSIIIDDQNNNIAKAQDIESTEPGEENLESEGEKPEDGGGKSADGGEENPEGEGGKSGSGGETLESAGENLETGENSEADEIVENLDSDESITNILT